MGTPFKVYFPRVRHGELLPQTAPAGKDYTRGSETVLLAEDEVAVRQATREFLSMNGYTVLEAGNGEDALAVAKSYNGTIHLIIADGVMPHMGGAKLAVQFAAERPEMKVLFVSGYAEPTFEHHGELDVTARFLQNPFSLRTPGRTIREVLDGAKPALSAVSSL